MKIHSVTLSAMLVAAVGLSASRAAAAESEKPASRPADAPSMEEVMKKWEAVATPGPAHKTLEAFVGDWNVSSKWWMVPDAPPAESKGTSKVSAILGGRFVQEDYAGTFMGKPMKGMGLTGYDNFKKKYVSLWVDDAGTAMFTSEGTADPDGKVFTFLGKMDDPLSGEKDKAVKYVIRLVGPDKRVFEMHELARGAKSLVAEMTYTRK